MGLICQSARTFLGSQLNFIVGYIFTDFSEAEVPRLFDSKCDQN